MSEIWAWIAILWSMACLAFAAHERGRRKGLEDAEKLFDPVMKILKSTLEREQEESNG